MTSRKRPRCHSGPDGLERPADHRQRYGRSDGPDARHGRCIDLCPADGQADAGRRHRHQQQRREAGASPPVACGLPHQLQVAAGLGEPRARLHRRAGADLTVETGGAGTLGKSMRATLAPRDYRTDGALTGLKSELDLRLVLSRRLHCRRIRRLAGSIRGDEPLYRRPRPETGDFAAFLI